MNEFEKNIITNPFIKSITFQKKNGEIELIDELNTFSHKNHPITSIPMELKRTLQNTLNKKEKNLFEYIISSSEYSDKTIENESLNTFVAECINGFMNSLSESNEIIDEDNENQEIQFTQAFYGPPTNLMIKLRIDKRLVPTGTNELGFNINDFNSINYNKFVIKSYSEEDQKVYNSIGLNYRFLVSGTKEDIFHLIGNTKNKNVSKIMDILFQPVGTEKSTVFWQCLDHFLLYEVRLAPFDRLGSNTGKLLSREKLKNKKYIVYIAKDEKGNVRYIGEGKPDRYKHVNSGVSHVYELNQEHFSGRKMKVEIYNENLSKEEALSIERFLLNKYQKCGLWNKKDYIKGE